MFYRVGLPLWRQAAQLGCPMMIRVNAFFDEEAKVFVATSPDLKGLVAEADTLDALEKEVVASASGLMSFQLQGKHRNKIYSELRVRDCLQMALV
ncbi:DUF1902 domain-containing protein [Polynucleobacter alcilacus]|jgi:Domain of unknown function (DUF1902)|uniref:DUF1902 domain-containing protein n=1 Tax=Polynucleobacter alcilacus TaxID=1819739 RepID=UPI001C0D4E4C|nr:DUF1902 domain-containing protein [Polynucleobacter alcilacus]MBU3566592.1 DUF1902 domain-containing protein [Polynucleobacter alcilacus]